MNESLKIYLVKDANRTIISIYRNEEKAEKAKKELEKTCSDKCPFYYIEAYIINDN